MVEVRRNDQVRADTYRPEKMPEQVKNMLKVDICANKAARCD
ncbi:hypothetical protein AKJ08_1534 [Vulgatibacter incomptus]|uniref:Uncharacterized protein n=2 Tax=Vulgatibacter incomptus TaxID=1391653 RepID=A0A0K1PCB0_9BACT|nr:hypothetical protein AKJ08_1534 [Vulgatibacter incomptus]